MTTFYRFIIALLSLALVLSLWQRGKQETAKAQAPDEPVFVSRFGNAKSTKTIKQINQELDEALQESKLNRAIKKVGL